MKKNDEKEKQLESLPPMGFQVIVREFLKDKVAIASLIIVIICLLVAFVGSLFIDQVSLMKVDILNKYANPSDLHWLGTDVSGKDVFGQLIVGARNSILIGFSITIITSIIGVSFGIISGYYGGVIDNILMRFVDFVMVLPTQMLIIVFVTIIPKYTIFNFVAIMSAFYWVGKARLFRSKTLSEGRRDYVSASKTLGTSSFKIMFREIMPNLSTLIITNLTINFAANIGIETGLSFLGFGLPPNVPSLGTLISFARTSDVLANKTWVWLPASLFILIMMLSINYIGQALGRSSDAKQRLG
ncbi:peptide ABC transporter permease [Enterococcus sp. JM4C]|uniref:ABC transporter permease n=1 Tax=Candidatus Enterococcus huntleyi TaxID=1857217 RepID=UPI00137AE89F|nr:ABC transporter permease [Enterococcus sp. JM4C]KAF1297913.1 peptide ABC transporter permease [Enterococcus sp. JM4C]